MGGWKTNLEGHHPRGDSMSAFWVSTEKRDFKNQRESWGCMTENDI